MDWERIISLIFVLSIIITLVSGAVLVFRSHIAFQEKRLNILGKKVAARDAARAADAQQLEERVRVLERIATDRGVDLAFEIQGLPKLERQEAPSETVPEKAL